MKGQSRLYVLKRLRSFDIVRMMLRVFYETVVSSAILLLWCAEVADCRQQRPTNSLVRKAGDVVRVTSDSFKAANEGRMLLKLPGILNNASHLIHQGLVQHQSTWSVRLIPPKRRTERHRRPFLPVVIRFCNCSCRG